MEASAARHLLDLDLEGIREAPLGVVVCCDRRAEPAGVLGRATFVDADVWSCVCAIQNLWLAARAEGLGVGWVTLFDPDDLAALVGAPDGVVTLGWLCVGWPDERPPAPGLERRGWSERLPLAHVVVTERWPASGARAQPEPPISRLAGPSGRTGLTPPSPADVVAAHDTGDQILSAPGSLGVLDRAVDRILSLVPARDRPGPDRLSLGPDRLSLGPDRLSLGPDRLSLGPDRPRSEPDRWPGAESSAGSGSVGALVIAAADHPVCRHGVSAYPREVTREVVAATLAGVSVGALAARQAGLDLVVVDAGVDGAELGEAVLARPLGRAGTW